MKKIVVLLMVSCLLFFVSCKQQGQEKEFYVFTSFHEPADEGLRYLYSEDGIHWDSIPGIWLKPKVGNQEIMRDPSIVHTPEGIYHLVWTSSWKDDLCFGYAYSSDLKNWSEQQTFSVMAYEPTTVNTWAPEIFYDDEKEKFIVVWASCIPGRFEQGEEEYANNHRLFYITTKDFKTVSETKLFYDPGFSSIDAMIVKRASKDYVLVFKDNTRQERNIKVAFAESPIGPYSPASKGFTEMYTEGPTIGKIGDEYWIYFDAYRKKTYGAVMTKDFINFTDKSDDIKIPNGHKHGTIFKAPESVVKGLLLK
ncbi:hypothetical protein EZS27_002706 [termite gut metagenome]|jgi:predicted GH43/DUF377 family glycosyl hydrolase|uniref:Arabinosidase n=1 Tax=termite gut metagenome TaxID=433724 RepID=A0A5J4SXI0_9ZZZZ